MAKMTVFYEETVGLDGIELAPMKMVIRFGRGLIPWDRNYIYIPIEAPFKRMLAEDFGDENAGMTVAIDDLTTHPDKPGHFGIYIPSIVRRFEQLVEEQRRVLRIPADAAIHYRLDDIEQLILQVHDVEEVMQMRVERFYNWRD